MKCSHCGSMLKEGLAFCPNCGSPVEQTTNNNPLNHEPDLMAPMSNVDPAQNNNRQEDVSNTQNGYVNSNSNVQSNTNMVNENINLKKNHTVSYSLGVTSLLFTLFINVYIGIIIGVIGVGVILSNKIKRNVPIDKKGLIFNIIAIVIGVLTIVIQLVLPSLLG